MRYLEVADLAKITELATAAAAAKGPDYFAWKNPPVVGEDGRITHSSGWGDAAVTKEITPAEALGVMEEKLNGAYSERLLLTVAYITSAVKAGVKVAFLQKAKEPGLPFKADGWVVVSVGTYPMFHVAPSDLALGDLAEAGLVNIVPEGSAEDAEHGWTLCLRPMRWLKLPGCH